MLSSRPFIPRRSVSDRQSTFDRGTEALTHLLFKRMGATSEDKQENGSYNKSRRKAHMQMAKWKLNRILRAGGIIFLPAAKYFHFLQELATSNNYRDHEFVLTPGIAQFAMVPDDMATNLFTHLLSYIEGSGKIAGLEDYFFSCMVHAQSGGHQSLYARGIRTWRVLNKPSAKTETKASKLYVYDRTTNILSLLSAESKSKLYAGLAKGGFASPVFGEYIRNAGDARPSSSPENIRTIFGAADDRDQCKDRTNSIVQIGGITLGIITGGVGAALTSGSTGDKLGILGTGLALGTGFGQGFSPLIATYGCKDKSAADANAAAVSFLVAAVQSGSMTLDEALDQAGKIGGEATAPNVSGTIDSLLNDSADPYSDVSIDDLANDLPTPTNDDTGKPANVDQDTWNQVTDVTTPATNDDTNATESTDNTDNSNPPTDPEGMPNPDGDDSGGPTRFGIGPLGPWAAGFNAGENATPNPDSDGVTGPLALPNGSVFFAAPDAFSRGLLNTANNITSVYMENASSAVSSCMIIGMPRLNNNGSIATNGLNLNSF